MSASLRARLAKLEQQVRLSAEKDPKGMSDDELCREINLLLDHARQVVWWHGNHPEGLNGPHIYAFTIEEVTLEMIVQSEHVEEGWRFAARTLIDAGYRRQQHLERISSDANRTDLR